MGVVSRLGGPYFSFKCLTCVYELEIEAVVVDACMFSLVLHMVKLKKCPGEKTTTRLIWTKRLN